jgi:hypothetical protein
VADGLRGVRQREPRGQFIVAQSSKPAITAQEAEASARQCAADALVPQVQSRMNGQIDIKLLRRHVEASLLSDNWIVDRQVEAKERPYGTIWRESILVDASSRKLDELGKRVQLVARREQEDG